MSRAAPITGLFSAIATPVAADGSLASGIVGRLAEQHVERGVEGIYCCGSSGESLLLSSAERRQVLEEVIDAVGGIVPVVAHVGAASTRDCLDLARHAAGLGVAAISMIPPIYYSYSDDEITRHYTVVMDAVDVPMIVYNIPQFTGREFLADHSLLSDPRVAGVKHTAPSMYQLERMAAAHPGLSIINGFDETYLAATVAGARGSIGTTISLQVDCFKAVRALLAAGDVAGAQQFQRRINDVIEELVAINVFPAAKWVEARLSQLDLGPCRAPFAPVMPADTHRLGALIEQMREDARLAQAELARV
ncbi:MAG: dihydrodipicolinate synthase family protein [Arachnia sp.]